MNPIEVKQFLKSKVLDFMKENKLKFNKESKKFTFDANIGFMIDDVIKDEIDLDGYCKGLYLRLPTKTETAGDGFICIESKISEYGFQIPVIPV